MREFLESFFGADDVRKLDDGDVEVVFRGVSRGNHKEFFCARLVQDDWEQNLDALRRARAELAEFEASGWEDRLAD
jgi:hypothetical protein